MHKVPKVRTLRSLMSQLARKGMPPMRGCGTRLALGCLLVVVSAMICGALIYRALGL
jgi:hypothetical protein